MGAMLAADPEQQARVSDAPAAVRSRPLRVLSLTTLFPSSANSRHGIFVETRLQRLRELAPVDLQVVAPVPWFPFSWRAAGRYATFAATPRFEVRAGVE